MANDVSVTDGGELDNPNSNTTTHLSTIEENESLLPATFRHNRGYTSLKRALSCEGDSDLFEGGGPPSKQHKLTPASIPAIDPSSLDIPSSLATSLPHHPAPASQSNNVTIPVATASTLATQPAQYHGVTYNGQQLNALDAPTQPWKPQYSINLLSLQILKYKSKNSKETCELSFTRELLDMCFEQMDPKTFTTIFVKHGRLLVEIRDLEEILGNTFVKNYLVKNGIPQGALAAPGGTQDGLMDPYRVLSIAFSSGCQECKRSTDYKYIYWVFCRCICELCMKEHMLSQDGVLEMLRQAKFKHPERIGMLLLCIVYKANGSAKPFYNRIYYDAIVRALITNYKAFEATENIPRTISFHTWCTRQQHRINNRLLAARLMRRWQNNVAAEEVRRHIEENDATRLERNLQIKAMVADMEPPIPDDVLEDCPAYKNQSTYAGLLTELAWTILEPKIKAYARSRRAKNFLGTLTNSELTTLQANINEEASKLVSDAVSARDLAIRAACPDFFKDAPQILLLQCPTWREQFGISSFWDPPTILTKAELTNIVATIRQELIIIHAQAVARLDTIAAEVYYQMPRITREDLHRSPAVQAQMAFHIPVADDEELMRIVDLARRDAASSGVEEGW
ncbi:hypothetical protein EG328_004191 [Venturia inaequalis]|uniref:Uncharacterized protein n=1 Tax=Venturia inaequalis TaxID=5025 RepID=A0A8H3UNL0_VENIN|nr:hypothetical protein EG328_004191 [Venturia inaequalis]